MKRDFISLFDLSYKELDGIIKRSIYLKKWRRRRIFNTLKGKTVALLFEKASTRTRVSFEVAINELGGNAIFLLSENTQLARGETIADTARTLSKYVDAIVLRTFAHSTIVELAKYASVPVINALSDLLHPCQALGDVMTIIEKKGGVKGIKLAYVGDGNNVANSLIEAATIFKFQLSLACPKGYEPDSTIVSNAKKAGIEIYMTDKPEEAVKNADVLYTDVWVSMGQEDEAEKRKRIFSGFQINETLLFLARKDAIVMHCLPAHRGEEISSEVIDGPQSVVWDQAENRLHTQKALLEFLLK